MKTEQDLKELQKEYNELKEKLAELTEEELKQVSGGNGEQGLSGRHNIRSPLTGE